MCVRLVSRIACVTLSAFLAANCASETESAARWDGSVRDSAGIEIVDNFGEPLWRPGEEWRLVEDLRIGVQEGPPEYQFGRITGFIELSDGRIAVMDGMAAELRFFGPEGDYLYSVGEEGEGPKEFGQTWLVPMRGFGDTILVADSRNQRVTRLSPEGEWLSSFSIRPQDGWQTVNWDTSPSGLIATQFAPLHLPDAPPVDTLDVIVVRNLDGSLGDTLGRVPTSQQFRFVDQAPERRYYAGRAFFDLRWDGQGLIVGRSDEYELTWYDRNDVPERIVRLHRERDPLMEEERSALMARLEGLLKRGNRSPERIQQLKNTIAFEPYYPYYRRFMNGPNGTLWIRRIRRIRDMTPEEIEELNFSLSVHAGPGFDVFDRDGRYLGIVQVPDDMPWSLIRGGRLFGIVRDEFDTEYLQIYRIEGPNPDDASG